MTESINSFAGALAALLEVPQLAEQLRRNLELAKALAQPVADKHLPPGVSTSQPGGQTWAPSQRR